MKLKLFLTIMTAVLVSACQQKPQEHQQNFVRVENGHFVKNGQPYYYVGTNFWYGAILGSEGQGGDRERLGKELDLMKEMGIDNLRILVGSDGERGVKTKVEPTLQEAPGVYNDTILAGLDYLLQELGKRDMVAVLYLNNSWEWSGGYGFYLEHAGRRLSCLYGGDESICDQREGPPVVLRLCAFHPLAHEPLYRIGL